MSKRVLLLIYFHICFYQAFVFSQTHDAELIYQETNIFVKNGKLYKDSSYEIMINNREGEEFATVYIPYSNLCKLSRVKGCIKDKNGNVIRKLKKSDIIDRSAISSYSFYEDDFVREFTLKHNRYPYIISYSYKTQEKDFFYIDYWNPVLNPKIPTRKAILNIEVPSDYRIKYKNINVDSVKVVNFPSITKYKWTTAFDGILAHELYSPPSIDFMPSVVVVPNKFKFDNFGSFKNWKSFGNWQYRLIKDLSDIPSRDKHKYVNLVDGLTDEREKIKILYHYLQDATRYVNISINTGGLKPYPASYVERNKYGDCKALTNYFKSVLDCVGIKSFYTLIKAGSPIVAIDKSFVSQQFNHAILSVPLKNDTIWVDCTSNGAFNYLGTFTQNRDVYVIGKDNSYFSRTPALNNNNVIETRKVSFSPKNYDKAIAQFEKLYRGRKYESLLGLSQNASELNKDNIIRNNFIEKGFQLVDYNLNLSDRDSCEMTLSYSSTSGRIYKKYGNDILIELLPFSIPPFENPKYRKMPVQIDYPIYKSDTLKYKIPMGYHISSMPKSKKVKNNFGMYNIDFLEENNCVMVIKTFLLNSGFYSIKEYLLFYKFLYEVFEKETNTHIVTTKQL